MFVGSLEVWVFQWLLRKLFEERIQKRHDTHHVIPYMDSLVITTYLAKID